MLNQNVLPDKPVVIIERSKPWTAVDLRGCWAYRDLFYLLVWRDLQIRYRQTALGAAWAVLQPLVSMLIFTYVFGKLARVPSDGVPYPLFAYSGLLTWTFFSNAVSLGSNSLAAHSSVITKVYFPRMVIPAAAVCGGLVDYAIALTLLIPLLIYYDMAFHWTLALLPLFMFFAMLLALGVGMLIAALTVRYRDIRYVFPFVMQVWFFLTPIIYPSSMLPEEHRWLLAFNPLTGIIEGSRTVLFGLSFAWMPLASSLGALAVLLVCGSYMFMRAEKVFAEYV